MLVQRSITRVGIYIDVANLSWNGGYGMKYDVLREFACRGNAEPIRLNAYVAYDEERAQQDPVYRDNQQSFYSVLRDFGYKVIEKTVKWYQNENGQWFGKANADLDMAVDVLLQSENMDRVLLVTGDGDFVRVVQALQNRGCRVEVVAFDNVSSDLRREADSFISGYLIPNLLPAQGLRGAPLWGELGSRARGICNYYNHEKHYGFFRVMKSIAPELWKVDARQEASPYLSVFFHDSFLPPEVHPAELPTRNLIFEFELAKSEDRENGMKAINVQLVSLRRRTPV
jgi:uncharacterized LabA/DUF88 family protein